MSLIINVLFAAAVVGIVGIASSLATGMIGSSATGIAGSLGTLAGRIGELVGLSSS